jgi:hypothetical protein
MLDTSPQNPYTISTMNILLWIVLSYSMLMPMLAQAASSTAPRVWAIPIRTERRA